MRGGALMKAFATGDKQRRSAGSPGWCRGRNEAGPPPLSFRCCSIVAATTA